MDNEMFIKKLKNSANASVDYKEIEGKSHIEMITQLEHKECALYNEIVLWIEKPTVINRSYSMG